MSSFEASRRRMSSTEASRRRMSSFEAFRRRGPSSSSFSLRRRKRGLTQRNVQGNNASSNIPLGDGRMDNETFLDSLLNKTQLNITNKCIERWTVHGEYLYFIDHSKNKIVVYSIEQRRVERELQHKSTFQSYSFFDLTFVGDRFLVSVGDDFVSVWIASDGTFLTSKKYEKNYGYKTCCAVSSTSFLYIQGCTIRRLAIATPNSTSIQLEEVNKTIFNEKYIWSSELCANKIALVFEDEKKLNIFDVTTFEITAQIDLFPHYKEEFIWNPLKQFDVSFPEHIVLCIANSTHSQFKILIFDPTTLNLRKSFVVQNPIYSTLVQHSKFHERGTLRIDAYASDAYSSDIRMQYNCDKYYQIVEISIDEEKLTNSYGFHVKKEIKPNCKSLNSAVIVSIKDRTLTLAETSNELKCEMEHSVIPMQGPIEQMYLECTLSGKRAVNFCERLSPTLFNGSLLEFYSAHRLLIMAIQDGDVQKSLHHNGVKLKWHEAIYSSSRNVIFETPEDRNELTLLLMEAAEQKVIESVSQYLLANDITLEVRDQNETIFNLTRQLFLRLIQLEAVHMNLDLAFERYRRVQGMTELMGIALNVIPFLGGSVAAAVTAGAELVEGLQISDVLDGALQLSVDMISNSPSFEQGVLRCVENSLRKEEIEKRVELLISLDRCDVTMDQLKEILKNGIHRNEETEDVVTEEPNPVEVIAKNLSESSISNRTSGGVAIAEELTAGEKPFLTEEYSCKPGIETCYQATGSSSQNRNDSNSMMCSILQEENVPHFEKWNISEFKKLSDDRDTVRSLTVRQCSYFVASLMLLFDDEYEEIFRKLQSLLLVIHRSRKISGKVLCNYEKYSNEIDGILVDLMEKYPVDNVMIGEFMDFVKK